MSDNADIANEIMQARIDSALAQRATPSTKQSALDCNECGDEIPEARRQAVAGTQHCTECAGMLERERFINGGN